MLRGLFQVADKLQVQEPDESIASEASFAHATHPQEHARLINSVLDGALMHKAQCEEVQLSEADVSKTCGAGDSRHGERTPRSDAARVDAARRDRRGHGRRKRAQLR